MDLTDIFVQLKNQCTRLESELCPSAIYFRKLNEKYSYLSNFYRSRTIIDGKSYLHVEGYYQSQKFIGIDDGIAEIIRNMSNPMDCKKEAHKHYLTSQQLDEWDNKRKLSVMRRGILCKFSSNTKLLNELLSTGNATLVEDAPWDNYWGNGKYKNGLNILGRILMEIRDILRNVNF